MTGPRRVDPRELGTDAPDELDDALLTAAWLENAMPDIPVRATPDFADRVMAALEGEPTPSAAGFLAPLRRLGFVAGFASSVREAWAAASSGGRPAFVRASALAYVLAVAIAGTALAGVATVGVGSALGLIGPSATQTPAPETIAPTPSNAPSGLEPSESDGPESSEEPGESGSPDATDDSGGSGPGASSDDGGGDTSGSGSTGSGSDDSSGPSATSTSGSDDHETATPRPSSTPRASGTPKPTQTSGSGSDG